MKQRLHRRARLAVATGVVSEQGRAYKRQGWVTQTIVAHGMGIRPGCYVLGLLRQLVDDGVLEVRRIGLANGNVRYEFRLQEWCLPEDEMVF